MLILGESAPATSEGLRDVERLLADTAQAPLFLMDLHLVNYY